MENRSYALMTGVFTIALLVAAILVGLWLNRDKNEFAPYEIITTQSIPGLNPQATVRYRGLEVGRVDEIVFDPKVTGQILIRLSVEEGSPITTTTFASLGYQGVTGIAFIQLDDDRTGSPLLRTDPEHVGRIPLRPGLLDQLEKRGLAILDRTEQITARINNLMSDENQRIIIGSFDNISRAAEAYGKIPERLGPTIDKLPRLADKLEQSLTSFDTFADSATSTVRNYDRLATGLQAPDGPLNRLNDAIGSLRASPATWNRTPCRT
ncbi:MlaD family protein [Massilia sp. Se16.2.3]|uniref:MlaD family protein n=1 Tax=Massilia sp. Se16.2.3 TaxID=2709303 RepID=UPI0028044084|nr:MlaD family protein [Massilia sp. Se16.2.3]